MTGRPAAHAALREAMAVAVHSPSSHNAQAWSLRVGGGPDGPELGIGVDPVRALRALPAHRIEMLLGLGTYWHALAVALRARGWALEDDLENDGDPQGTDVLTARMVPAEPDPAAAAECDLIVRRRTGRGPYTGEPIGPDARRDVVDGAVHRPAWTAAAPPVDAHVLTGRAELDAVADLTRAVAPRDFLHRKAWRETARHLHRDAVLPRARTGFGYGDVFGPRPWPLDHLVVALTSPALMPVTGRLGLAGTLAGRLAAAVGAGPGLLVLTAPPAVATDAGFAWAGTDLHRAWLAASRHGLSLHPVSVLLQHDDSRRELERRLALAGRAVFVARIGHGVPGRSVAPVVRRAPEAVLTAGAGIR